MVFHIGRSELMSRIRSRDTGPELRLRQALWSAGLRYRVSMRIERIAPDVVFVGPKVCVFVDGCFWHGCPIHYRPPRKASEFWATKLGNNVARDIKQIRVLESAGWRVVRLLEHDVNDAVDNCVARVRAALSGEPNRAVDWRVIGYKEGRAELVELYTGDRSWLEAKEVN